MFRFFIVFLSFYLYTIVGFSHESEAWFYIRAKDTLFNPRFNEENNTLQYIGEDAVFRNVIEKYTLKRFKKSYRDARVSNLKRTFFVIADRPELLEQLVEEASHLFEFGEHIAEADKKIFEPNDYGLTSTIGDHQGLDVNLDYLDYLEVPKAWYYTTGSRDIIIGISDATIDTLDPEFIGKSKIIRKSSLAKGHGFSVAATAAGQGDNGYGFTGICSNCSIYATTYGSFKTLDQLLELSRLGVKVINCSWAGTRYYETAQAAINEMFNKGTIIVASAGNKPWSVNKGEVLYYPASYDKVISVSTVMHRYDIPEDHVLISERTGKFYGENIKNYIGRTFGFRENDLKGKQTIYPISTKTLNKEVDVLAPGVGVFRYGEYALSDKIDYSKNGHTSGITPLVTGTIGLMFSLYPCLPVDEVESILKMTSTNIDYIEANKPYKGNYGAGALNTGRAVKFVYDLYDETQTVYIENQDFSRWDFKLTAHAKQIYLRNQKFTDSSTLNIEAKHQIVLGEHTTLRPDENGAIRLKINEDLEQACSLRLRESGED